VPYQDYRAGQPKVQRLQRVRALREDQTDAERALWQRLRSRQIDGYKFRRQHEFGGFVLDFFCVSAKLAVELDGGQHLSEEGLARDARRSAFLEANGIRVLRFTNTQVLGDSDAVLEAIARDLQDR